MRNILLLGLFLCASSQAATPEKPMNVLLILVDDLNDWVGVLGGNHQTQTPNIDRLASRGMLFANAHTSASACQPSRVSLMTGVQPARSGITQNVFARGEATWRKSPVLKNATTLSQAFRDQGYKALCGGKIYHTLQGIPTDENDYSTWDEVMPGDAKSGSPIAFQPRATKKLFDPATVKGLQPVDIFTWSPIDGGAQDMADHTLVSWAETQLNKSQGKPFFLAVGLFRPHIPWEVPQEFFDRFPLKDIQIPQNDPYELEDCYDHGRRHWHRWVMDNQFWESAVQSYLASIAFADFEVGRLMDALDASGHSKDTIVVLWSDHGMHLGEKENWEKFTLYEESTRIPIIIIDPRQKPGVSHAPVASVDLFPTLLELTGIRYDSITQKLDGESMADVVRGGTSDLHPAITTYKDTHSVRSERYRYIYCEPEDLEELYDHETDPEEKHNLAYHESTRATLQQHRTWLREAIGVMPPSGFTPPEPFALLPNGDIQRKDFKKLDQVAYVLPPEKQPLRRKAAIEKLNKERLPFRDGAEE